MNSNKLFYLRVTAFCLARKVPLLLEHSQVGGISPFDVATLREVDSWGWGSSPMPDSLGNHCRRIGNCWPAVAHAHLMWRTLWKSIQLLGFWIRAQLQTSCSPRGMTDTVSTASQSQPREGHLDGELVLGLQVAIKGISGWCLYLIHHLPPEWASALKI